MREREKERNTHINTSLQEWFSYIAAAVHQVLKSEVTSFLKRKRVFYTSSVKTVHTVISKCVTNKIFPQL